MRMIGQIPAGGDGSAAERFSDYLLSQGVENMVEETPGSGGQWAVWIEKDDDVERGKLELEWFLKNPHDPKYAPQSARAKAAAIRKEREVGQQRRRRQFIDVRTNWATAQQWRAPVTIGLIIITVIVSIVTNSIGLGGEKNRKDDKIDYLLYTSVSPQRWGEWYIRTQPLFTWRSADDAEPTASMVIHYWLDNLRRGEVWRLVTPIFIHWSPLHLIFNLFWLRDLGGMIETRRGSLRMLGLVLLAALISNFAQFAWTLPKLEAGGGMSGVVYALFGYVWVKDRYEPHLGLHISKETSIIMIAWLFLCMTGLVGPIGNAAHVAGLVVGAATGWAGYQYKRVKTR